MSRASLFITLQVRYAWLLSWTVTFVASRSAADEELEGLLTGGGGGSSSWWCCCCGLLIKSDSGLKSFSVGLCWERRRRLLLLLLLAELLLPLLLLLLLLMAGLSFVLIKFLFNFSMGKYTLETILRPLGASGTGGCVIGFSEAAPTEDEGSPTTTSTPCDVVGG